MIDIIKELEDERDDILRSYYKSPSRNYVIEIQIQQKTNEIKYFKYLLKK